MVKNETFESVLFNKTVFKILNYLLEHKKQEFSIRELSIKFEIDYKTTYQTIEKISNSINISKKGSSKFISYKPKLTTLQYLTEKQRTMNLLKNPNFKILSEEIKSVNKQGILLLFGSHVKGKETKHSDIDLLLISDELEDMKSALSILDLPLHLTTITNDEFVLMLKSKEFSVVSEATTNNYILEGIESYYRFIENVNKTTPN